MSTARSTSCRFGHAIGTALAIAAVGLFILVVERPKRRRDGA